MKIGIVHKEVEIIKAFKSAFSKQPDYQVLWLALDVPTAVIKSNQNAPNIILMSIEAVDASMESLAKIANCPILLLTDDSLQNKDKAFSSIIHGVMDFAPLQKEELLRTNTLPVVLHEKLNQLARLITSTEPKKQNSTNLSSIHSSSKNPLPLVIIGSSTGGPAALANILRVLNSDHPFSVVVIQHVDDNFIGGLVNWLNQNSILPVEIAEEGVLPTSGKVLMARASHHLVMTSSRKLEYTSKPEELSYKPSIDVFFKSVAENWPDPSVAVLLTGMGNDGAAGLKELLDTGWHTIVQEEESCVVYGMPKAAIEMKAAKEILPIDEIGEAVIAKLQIQGRNNARSY